MRTQWNGRTIAAVTILFGWGLGVAAFARGEMNQTTTDRMAEMALRVAPGATYYAAEFNGKQVGFGSTTIDTLPRTLQISDYAVADMPDGDSTQRVTSQLIVRVTRGLALREFNLSTARDSTRRRVRGWIVDDSTLAFTIVAPGVPRDTQHVKMPVGILLPPMVPMAVALGADLEVGAKHVVETFDPVALVRRTVRAEILAESTFVIADSAVYDSARAKWAPAHMDTLTGWRMAIAGSATPDVWIDQKGHPIGFQTLDGLVMRRTAYELAFENWRMARPKARSADSLARGTALNAATRRPTP